MSKVHILERNIKITIGINGHCFYELIMNSYQFLIKGMSMARLVRPDLRLKGLGAQSKAIPLAVLSVYRGVSLRKGSTNSGSSNSSSSSGSGS